jgi:hypothetical protein
MNLTSYTPQAVRRRASLLLASGGAALVLATVGPMPAAEATMSHPSTAPTALVGVQYFGNTDHCAGGELLALCNADLWRLPALLAGDVVTVAWRHTSTSGPKMCITGNVDDFDFVDNRCNRSRDQYGNSSTYGSQGGKRTVMSVPAAANPAYLTFLGLSCFTSCSNRGPYEFTVEKIQHRVLGAIPARTSVKRTGSITARPGLTNGSALVGATFTLKIKVTGQKLRIRSAKVSSAGTVTFKISLPKSARGKRATFQLTRGATSTTLSYASAKTTIKIKRK